MRIDSQPAPISNTTERREVKGVSAIHALKPIEPYAVHDVVLHKQGQSARVVFLRPAQGKQAEDRRKKVRRTRKHAVLIELRVLVDRRHQREHIDEEA